MKDEEVWETLWPLLSGENSDILRQIMRAIVGTARENGMTDREIASELMRIVEQLQRKAQ